MTNPMITAIGMMSGTSLDGVDAALLTTDGEAALSFGPALTLPYDDAFRARLHAAIGESGAVDGTLAADLADIHAEAAERLIRLSGCGAADIDVVGFHGQTVFHDPARGRTRQIGDAQRLADRLDIAVCYDFRSADMAAGGQGAPMVPVFHQALARQPEMPQGQPLAFVNIGGVANITFVGADGRIVAFDTGPGNAPLDDWVLRHSGVAYDRDGALALAGTVDQERLDRLLADPFLDLPGPKSLDRNAIRDGVVDGLSPADGAATLAAFTAGTIAAAVRHLPEPPAQWLICGGGRHNPAIMRALARTIAAPVAPIEAAGLDGDAIEAQAFAYLAVRVRRGLPTSLPSTTGARHPVSGGRLAIPHHRAYAAGNSDPYSMTAE